MSDVLDKIINTKRLPVLFIGSGVSKRYLIGYPSWSELLDNVRKKIGISKTSYSAYIQDYKVQQPDISSGKLNQKLASFLREKLLDKIKNDEIDLDTLFSPEEVEKCVNDGVDFFKMLVSKTFFEYKIIQEKQDELELFKKISSKISMVFTTNYDNFLQNEVFQEFKVYEHQNKYYFRTNNGYGEIYKIHGCISDPNSLIICESDYDNFENSLKLVSSKLLNALMDYPIIFLGYSLEDENIKKLMADFVNSFDDNILQDIKKYIILVIYEKNQQDLIEGEKQFVDTSTGRNITLTTIKTDNYEKIFNYIDKLTPAATSYELRKYKTMIANLISRNAKGEKTIFVQEIDKANADITALYIGSKQTISNLEASVNIYSNSDIIYKGLEEIDFDYDSFAMFWYESKCVKQTEYTPVYLIADKMSINYESCCEKFKNNYNEVAKVFRKSKNIIYNGNIDTLYTRYESLKKEGKPSKNICDALCIDCFNALFSDKIQIPECQKFLNHIKDNEEQAKTLLPLEKLLAICGIKSIIKIKKAQRINLRTTCVIVY